MACRHPHWVQGRAAPSSIVRRCGGGQHGEKTVLAVEVLHLRPVERRRRGVAPGRRPARAPSMPRTAALAREGIGAELPRSGRSRASRVTLYP
eukprot:1000706-Prymnesium_polylepis.1